MKKILATIGLIIVPICVLMILGVLILKIGTITTFFSGVLFMATALNQQTGMNIWLARAIAAPILFFGYYYGLRNILSLRGNKGLGYGALIGVWCVICLSMYATQGNFSRTEGKANKYYFRDYKGQIVLRDYNGVDAETGTKLQPVNPDIIKEYQLQQDGTLKVSDNTLFDPQTGKPLKRYYKEKDGTISLFPLEVQFHPQYGTELQIITTEIAQKMQTQPATREPVSISESKPIPATSRKSFKVSAVEHSVAKKWLSTGIQVTRNQTIEITATGRWWHYTDSRTVTDADGMTRDIYDRIKAADAPDANLYLIPAQPFSLIGRIGSEGKPFIIGTDYKGNPSTDGILYLGFNDINYQDNSGEITATVIVR